MLTASMDRADTVTHPGPTSSDAVPSTVPLLSLEGSVRGFDGRVRPGHPFAAVSTSISSACPLIDAKLDRLASRVEMDGESGSFTFDDRVEAINELAVLFVRVVLRATSTRS